jgi:hypothetical protein
VRYTIARRACSISKEALREFIKRYCITPLGITSKDSGVQSAGQDRLGGEVMLLLVECVENNQRYLPHCMNKNQRLDFGAQED